MVTISIKELTLSDGSKVHDVFIRGGSAPNDEIVLHAVTCADAEALAEQLAQAIGKHTVHSADIAWG